MNKLSMEIGLAQGRTLIQEEWADREEIRIVDELIEEGKAISFDGWHYEDNFQCSMRRIVKGPRI